MAADNKFTGYRNNQDNSLNDDTESNPHDTAIIQQSVLNDEFELKLHDTTVVYNSFINNSSVLNNVKGNFKSMFNNAKEALKTSPKGSR